MPIIFCLPPPGMWKISKLAHYLPRLDKAHIDYTTMFSI